MTKKCQSDNPLFKIIVSEDTNLANHGESESSCHLGAREKYPKETQSESILNKSSGNKVGKEKREMTLGSLQKSLKRGCYRKVPNPYLRKLVPIGMDKKSSHNQEKQFDSIRVKELHNKLFEVKSQLEEFQKENVQLKTLQKRQEVEIKKLEDSKAEMPRTIKTYQEEHRIMSVKLKDLRLSNRELERKIKQKDDEIISLKLQNTHLVKLTKDRNLLEREKLMKKVQQFESQVGSLEEANKKLAKKCELEEKRMNSILRLEVTKHRETKNHLTQALKTIEILQGRNINNYVVPQPKKVVSSKPLEETPSTTSINRRSKSGVKIERKPVSNTSLEVVEAPAPPKITLPIIAPKESRENVKRELETPKVVKSERVAQPPPPPQVVENVNVLDPTPAEFPEIDCENNLNGDIFSVDNLDWEEIKKYVHPRKEELIVKIENMFAKEQTEKEDISELEFEEQITNYFPSSDPDKKETFSNSSSSLSQKQFSTDSSGKDDKKDNQNIKFTPKMDKHERRKSISAILNRDDPEIKITMKQKSAKSSDLGSKEETSIGLKDDNLFKSEQQFNQSKTKKNKNADILKYIFGKELLFEVNPE